MNGKTPTNLLTEPMWKILRDPQLRRQLYEHVLTQEDERPECVTVYVNGRPIVCRGLFEYKEPTND